MTNPDAAARPSDEQAARRTGKHDSDIDAWFAELDRFAAVLLFEDGRHQPIVPGSENKLGHG